MEITRIVLAVILLAAVAGVVYPFKPFGRRRNALLTFIACFVVFGVMTPGSEQDRLVNAFTRNTVEKTANIASKLDTLKDDVNVSKREKIEQAVRKSIEAGEWKGAKNHYQRLVLAALTTDEFESEMESLMLLLVKPIAASEQETNLDGYQFLATVRPKKSEYVAKVKIYREAIEASRKRVVSNLRKKEDKVEGITWFQHPNAPKYLNSRSTVYLYIGRKGKTGRPWLRMKVQYTSSDWLFVENVKAWHDGVKEPFISGAFERDNNTTIWEWVDVTPKDYQIEILRTLANSKESILRFEGNQYRRDVKLSAGDKVAIREVLKAYEIMSSGN